MKKKINNGIFYVVISLVVVLGIASFVVAYSGYGTPKVVVEGDYIEAQAVPGENLGASPSPNFFYPFVSFNGETIAYQIGRFNDASTTIVGFVNPFGLNATSTVDLVRLDITTAATSTYTIECGNSTGPTTASTDDIISSGSIATSTIAIVENNIAATEHANGVGIGGGTIAKITLASNVPYFTCVITSDYTGAFTEGGNAFDGKYVVRVNKVY